MILTILTAIIPAAVAALPGLSRRTPFLIDSVEDCRFRAGARQYDLCAVFADAAERPLLVKSKGKEAHRLHLGGNSSSSTSYCSSGAWICLISPSEPHTEIPISGASCSIITLNSEDSDESVTLQFAGSSENLAVRIQFVCDRRAELGQPLLLGIEDTLHSFTWRTRYACESGPVFDVMGAESDAPPPSEDNSEPSEPDEDSEQLLEGDRQRNSRRSTAVIFLVISILITSISLISYKYTDRLNPFLTEHVKPIFNRLSLDNFPRISLPRSLKPAGEGRLVRWAHEELELDEDFMVNGNDAYDEPEEIGDEYIPLRPSPRKGGRAVKNYGSATSPFW
ncbi:hypothetical protein B0H17DRAFT_1102557 [Mycena rosella]|uniref:MRH domain-containing protein n=1 Tax=Mycena rosella TaxID=1033263 RepID=A0AAD7CHH8_MYCRO|nr:hypothetical protein B0H17DRAFT_1102557 [Mycena rosella]